MDISLSVAPFLSFSLVLTQHGTKIRKGSPILTQVFFFGRVCLDKQRKPLYIWSGPDLGPSLNLFGVFQPLFRCHHHEVFHLFCVNRTDQAKGQGYPALSGFFLKHRVWNPKMVAFLFGLPLKQPQKIAASTKKYDTRRSTWQSAPQNLTSMAETTGVTPTPPYWPCSFAGFSDPGVCTV